MTEMSVNGCKAEDVKPSRAKMEEQETVVTWYRGDDEVTVWTSDNTVLTKMKKLMPGGASTLREIAYNKSGEPIGYRFSLPLECVKFGKKRIVSDEQRAAMAERAKKCLHRDDMGELAE